MGMVPMPTCRHLVALPILCVRSDFHSEYRISLARSRLQTPLNLFFRLFRQGIACIRQVEVCSRWTM